MKSAIMDHARALVIDPGDVGGLVALTVADRPDRLICWHPVFDDPAGARRRKAAAEHAVLYGVEHYIEFPAAVTLRAIQGTTASADAGVAAAHSAPRVTTRGVAADAEALSGVLAPGGGLGLDPIVQAILLLAAADAARRHRCEEIIWPIHCGADFDAVCDICERMILLQQLLRDANDVGAVSPAPLHDSHAGSASAPAPGGPRPADEPIPPGSGTSSGRPLVAPSNGRASHSPNAAGSASTSLPSAANGRLPNAPRPAAQPAPAAADVKGPRRIRAPFLDFTDHQMVDLLIRGNAPTRTAWWCEQGGDQPCRQCGACERWWAAFAKAGVANPWDEVMAIAR